MKIITSDGETFESMSDARRHERELKAAAKKAKPTVELVNLLTIGLPAFTPEDIDAIVALIQADPLKFRKAVAPVLRGSRQPRSDRGVPRKGGKPSAVAA